MFQYPDKLRQPTDECMFLAEYVVVDQNHASLLDMPRELQEA